MSVDYTTPLRDFLDDLNSNLQSHQRADSKQLDTVCQTLGINGINFVGDIRNIGMFICNYSYIFYII